VKKDSISELPRARKENLIVKEVDGEVLVYDLTTDKAHCLNNTSALVWSHCDGRNSVSDISQLLAAETKTEANDAIVWLALDEFQKFNLLEGAPISPAYLSGMSRRQWVRNVGLAALALPVIMSIAAPTPAQSASQCACVTPNCKPVGCPCTLNVECTNKCTGGFCA
jgi:hypothetical protein